MAISADMVKNLREQTGAGMMDCKKALTETNGDFEKAIAYLREKGIAVAAKRESKTASEGMIGSYVSEDLKTGVLVELNCETTFVAKTDEFITLATDLAAAAAKNKCDTIDCLMSEQDNLEPGRKLGDRLNEVMGKVGEKMDAPRLVRFEVSGSGLIGSYIHMGGQIGVLVELECSNDDVAKSEVVHSLAKDIAMQVSWSNPEYLKRDDVPESELEKEREIHRQWAIKEGKPENVIDRIVEGRMKEFFSRTCLLEQPFIKDEDQTIQSLIKTAAQKSGGEITIKRYARYRIGETSGGGD